MTENKIENRNIVEFMANIMAFANERCPIGSGFAVSRADVVTAAGLNESHVGLITELTNGGFIPGWKIRGGRDGGFCRVGEEAPKSEPKSKLTPEWCAQLTAVLDAKVSHEPKAKPVARNDIAHALHAITNEDLLKLPAKISEALLGNMCANYTSKRGAGIVWAGPAEVQETIIASEETELNSVEASDKSDKSDIDEAKIVAAIVASDAAEEQMSA